MSFRQLLLIRSSQPENVCGRFAQEILRAEGLAGFEQVDLDARGLPALGVDDLAILTRCFLIKGEMDWLRESVQGGGRVACIQTSRQLAERLGWKHAATDELPA